jgi:hypothetical protein
MYKQNSIFTGPVKEYCVGALDIALFALTSITIKKGCCTLKNTLYMVQKHFLFKG